MKNSTNVIVKNEAIFMKLGFVNDMQGNILGGQETINTYIKNCKQNGYTWYSTNGLSNGMNVFKVKKFNDLASTGQLKIYFAMNQDGIDNDIAYVADVEQIISNKVPINAPCEEFEYPEEWTGEEKRIWIKIRNLKREDVLTANDFVVVSSGNVLKDVISRGRYIFGYICRK